MPSRPQRAGNMYGDDNNEDNNNFSKRKNDNEY